MIQTNYLENSFTAKPYDFCGKLCGEKKLNTKRTKKKKHEVRKVKLTPKLKKTRLLD